MNDDAARREPMDGTPEHVSTERSSTEKSSTEKSSTAKSNTADSNKEGLHADGDDLEVDPDLDDLDLGDLPVMNRSALRRATWLGVARSAAIAMLAIVALDAVWSRLGAPAIATRHDRDRVIEEQIRGSLQSLNPSSLVAPPRRTIGRDGSLHYQFFLLDPVPSENPTQRMFEFEVSPTGSVDVDDGAFSIAISSSETLRYRDASRVTAAEFVTAVAQLPPGAVVSFALHLPSPLDDTAADALWQMLDDDGVTPGGYLLAPDRPGNPRGWSGPELDGYRNWDAAMSRDDGVDGGYVGITGASAGRAPDAAVIGLVFNSLPADRVAVATERTGATEATAGPVGLSLNQLMSPQR